jgi:hypothetical protein
VRDVAKEKDTLLYPLAERRRDKDVTKIVRVCLILNETAEAIYVVGPAGSRMRGLGAYICKGANAIEG